MTGAQLSHNNNARRHALQAAGTCSPCAKTLFSPKAALYNQASKVRERAGIHGLNYPLRGQQQQFT